PGGNGQAGLRLSSMARGPPGRAGGGSRLAARTPTPYNGGILGGMNAGRTSFPIAPPIEPMLAKLADVLPGDGDYLYEPKWDGFRAIVFRGGADVFIQSRDLKPLERYFPDVHAALLEQLPPGCVVGGESVSTTPRGTHSCP